MSDFNKIHRECYERYLLAIEPYIRELVKLEILQPRIVIKNTKGEYLTKTNYSIESLKVKKGIEQIIESIRQNSFKDFNKRFNVCAKYLEENTI